MVAYTGTDCLPYFEGSDSPCVNTGTVCEPSTVWCDMATIIDNILTGFDETMARAVESFPFAQVAISNTPFTLSSGASSSFNQIVAWDTVLGDSDNMVNLDVDANTITVRRSGIWNARFVTVWRSSLNDTRLSNILTFGTQVTAAVAAAEEPWVEAVPDPGTVVGGVQGLSTVMDAYYLVDASAGGVPFNATLNAFAASAFTLTVESVRWSMRWVADTP